MKALGIDFGEKRLGIAISNDEKTIAFPRTALHNDASALKKITALVHEEGVDTIVVGDARAFSGAENPITPAADQFARSLGELGIAIERAKEAYSSIEASRFAPEGQQHNDAAAAAIILQRFLDTKRR